jgi:hypothetical protein
MAFIGCSLEVLDLLNTQPWLTLAGQHVPAIYGSSGDVKGHEADPTFSGDAAEQHG